MKRLIYKSHITVVGIGLLAMTATSCSDSFLDEKMVSTITQDYFETEQGLDQLIVSTYNAERLRHPYTEGGYMFEVGHDCGLVNGNNTANQFSSAAWNTSGAWNTIPGYGNSFMGTQSKQQSGFIINCYPVISCCTKAITSIRSGKAAGKYSSDASYAAKRLSEALFNRDYLLYTLNTLWGDIYVPTEPVETTPTSFYYKRTPSAQMWSMMIADMRYAFENLPESYADAEFGRITKYAAAHFLAKLYLQRAQGAGYGTEEYGRKADGTIDTNNPKSYLGMLYKGNVATDLDSCIYYASQVIGSGKYTPEPVYGDIFKRGYQDWSNENSKEIILAAVFGYGTDNYRYGNRTPVLFAGNYVDEKWGIPAYTWNNESAPNTTYHNNDWGFDVFTDKINDARYQQSFHLEYTTALLGGTTTVYGDDLPYYAYDSDNNKTYTWTEKQADYFNANILPTYNRESWGGRRAVAGEHKMGSGDLAFAYLENTKETAIDVEEADAQPFVLFARWMKKDGKYYYRPQIVTSGNQYSFVGNLGDGVSANHYGLEGNHRLGSPCTIKYNDPNRTKTNSYDGTFDIPIYRIAETYLLRAEAYGRKGEYSKACDDINVLRQRAAFKAGQTRSEVIARLYPGHENLTTAEQQYPYTVENDCYSKIKVDESYWDGTSEKSKLENYTSAANTTEKRFVEFIYNEYAREFNEEEMYYEGIHHAGIQAQRIQWHNQMGANPNNTTYPVGDWSNQASDNTTSTTGQDGTAKGAFQNYMTLKPFHDDFINLLTDESGNALTPEAKKAYQNYGYNQ